MTTLLEAGLVFSERPNAGFSSGRAPVGDLQDEIIVDNFAGGGGASTGIYLALGRHPDIAVNHDPAAVAMHRANHPQTRHYCEDVWDVDPVKAVGGKPVGLAWFSPDCTFFSKARGGKPFRDRRKAMRRRGLAWIVVKWAKLVAPRVIMLENVEEIQNWGPLLEDGRPCPLRKGFTFRRWVKQMQNLGYAVEWRELRGCDYGAPTIRKRLFLIARRDGEPIRWPAPTHGDPQSDAVKQRRLKPWRTAADCIDWSLPCPSIFDRKRPLAEATLKRIAKGVMRYVVNTAEPFIVPMTHAGGDRVHDVNEPLRTVTTAHRGELALCAPTVVGIDHRGSGDGATWTGNAPLTTVTGEARHALVAAFLAKHYSGVVGADLRAPGPTVTSVDHTSLVTSNLVKLRGGGNIGQATDEPLRTISAGGTHFAEVRAFLIAYYGTQQDAKLRDPLHTVTTKDRYGLVTVHGQRYAIIDIGLRMLSPAELFRAQGFPASYIIDHGLGPHGERIPFTKSAQVRLCGNSVCPPIATEIIAANFRAAQTAIARDQRSAQVGR